MEPDLKFSLFLYLEVKIYVIYYRENRERSNGMVPDLLNGPTAILICSWSKSQTCEASELLFHSGVQSRDEKAPHTSVNLLLFCPDIVTS